MAVAIKSKFRFWDLKRQIEKAIRNFFKWPEAAFLGAGRAIYLWIDSSLDKRISNINEDIKYLALNQGVINNQEVILLRQLLYIYNKLKHESDYLIQEKIAYNLLINFYKIFVNKKEPKIDTEKSNQIVKHFKKNEAIMTKYKKRKSLSISDNSDGWEKFICYFKI